MSQEKDFAKKFPGYDSNGRWYGFNLLNMFSAERTGKPAPVDRKELDFMAKEGFNYIRYPLDYTFWIHNFRYTEPDESVFEHIDKYIEACRERKLHVTINIHRGPGYCINGNDREKHNLWHDKEAQEGFVFQWETFAKRYKGIPGTELSFDLLNEPPNIGQYGFTRNIHETIMRRVFSAIKAADPDRLVCIDGIDGGHTAIPELADLPVVHCGRGYVPFSVSHYKAGWNKMFRDLPKPVYPGSFWEGTRWDKQALKDFYAPWRDVEKKGTPVFIGEMGCYNKTPNNAAMAWLTDLLGLFREYQWGFCFWNFQGPFGIVRHGRPGAKYTSYGGYKVDMPMLQLLKDSMV